MLDKSRDYNFQDSSSIFREITISADLAHFRQCHIIFLFLPSRIPPVDRKIDLSCLLANRPNHSIDGTSSAYPRNPGGIIRRQENIDLCDIFRLANTPEGM